MLLNFNNTLIKNITAIINITFTILYNNYKQSYIKIRL
jgi:hypothetical protein